MPLASRVDAVSTTCFQFPSSYMCLICVSKVCVLDIDIQGVKAVKASFLRAKYVFISPPSIEVTEIRQTTQFCLSGVHE